VGDIADALGFFCAKYVGEQSPIEEHGTVLSIGHGLHQWIVQELPPALSLMQYTPCMKQNPIFYLDELVLWLAIEHDIGKYPRLRFNKTRSNVLD